MSITITNIYIAQTVFMMHNVTCLSLVAFALYMEFAVCQTQSRQCIVFTALMTSYYYMYLMRRIHTSLLFKIIV